jgi:hypothetical protein
MAVGKVYSGLLSTMTIVQYEIDMPELSPGNFGFALNTNNLFIGVQEKGNVKFPTNRLPQDIIIDGSINMEELLMALNQKVDKQDGKTLISTSEAIRLSSVYNYDDTEIKRDIENKVDKEEGKVLIEETELNRLKNVISYDDTVFKDVISNKVDKEEGKSLVDDNEIFRLGTLENYDDSEIRELIDSKSDIAHEHEQYITEHQDLTEYAKLTDIPTVTDLLSDIPDNYSTTLEVKDMILQRTITTYSLENYIIHDTGELVFGRPDVLFKDQMLDFIDMVGPVGKKNFTGTLNCLDLKRIFGGRDVQDARIDINFGSYIDITIRSITVAPYNVFCNAYFIDGQIHITEFMNCEKPDLSNFFTEELLQEKGYTVIDDVRNIVSDNIKNGDIVNFSGFVDNEVYKQEMLNKVDKEEGKSLIEDSELSRLRTLENYDDTFILTRLHQKAEEVHTHTFNDIVDLPEDLVYEDKLNEIVEANKSYTNNAIAMSMHGSYKICYSLEEMTEPNTLYLLLDTIDSYSIYLIIEDEPVKIGTTNIKVEDYYLKEQVDELLDNKSNIGHGHSYNDLVDKPESITKLSELENDMGFITGFDMTDIVYVKGDIDLHEYFKTIPSGKSHKFVGYDLINAPLDGWVVYKVDKHVVEGDYGVVEATKYISVDKIETVKTIVQDNVWLPWKTEAMNTNIDISNRTIGESITIEDLVTQYMWNMNVGSFATMEFSNLNSCNLIIDRDLIIPTTDYVMQVLYRKGDLTETWNRVALKLTPINIIRSNVEYLITLHTRETTDIVKTIKKTIYE